MVCFNYGQMQLLLLAVQMLCDSIEDKVSEYENSPEDVSCETRDIMYRALIDAIDIRRTLEGALHE